jgi:hypothetical protein
MPIPELLRLLSADCPRRHAARVAEPCGAHLPQLAVISGRSGWRPLDLSIRVRQRDSCELIGPVT